MKPVAFAGARATTARRTPSGATRRTAAAGAVGAISSWRPKSCAVVRPHCPCPAQWLQAMVLPCGPFAPWSRQHMHVVCWQGPPRANNASGKARSTMITTMASARRIAPTISQECSAKPRREALRTVLISNPSGRASCCLGGRAFRTDIKDRRAAPNQCAGSPAASIPESNLAAKESN